MKCREYRLNRKRPISQNELAQNIGETQATISKLERGHDITGRKWAKLMKATGGRVNPVAEYAEELDL